MEFELNEETNQPNVIINSKSSKNIGSFLNMISANTTQVGIIYVFSRKNSKNIRKNTWYAELNALKTTQYVLGILSEKKFKNSATYINRLDVLWDG